MANTFTTDTAVLRYGELDFGGPVNKSLTLKHGTLVIDTPGGAEVGDLPASLFGFSTIVGCSTIMPSVDDAIIVASPDSLGTSILVKTAASNATADLPNGSYYLTVVGY